MRLLLASGNFKNKPARAFSKFSTTWLSVGLIKQPQQRVFLIFGFNIQ
jgi:hypothetical protein